ncbi:MAG: Sensor histidine kinase RcsC [Phycisphaerae bacterium]|nr:Sensor histidine kinase RcsC [Phycisphaerae bacterium]
MRQNRARAATTAVNQLMVRARDEDEMLQAACRVLVDIGGYRMVWVGLADDDEQRSISIAAIAGHEEGYLRAQNLTWADVPRGRGPAGLAIRTGKPAVAQRIASDPSYEPWRAEAMKRGYAAAAAFPLAGEDRPLGAIVFYSSEADSFDEHEMGLLAELADDLAFGARVLRTRKRLDITQEQLRQAQRLEAIGRLAGGVAHDFNNLLTVIMGYSELAMRTLGPDMPIAEHLKEIHACSQRATTLTRQLLAFSRRQILDPRNADLNEIVAGVTRVLKRIIGEDIDLSTIPTPDLWTVRVDPGQMEQVLMNLATNSRDAMPHGGRLIMETHNITLDASYAQTHPEVVPGDYVMLAVSDNGCGMNAQTMARIFEPFFTTKEKGKGTGLGLAMVYGIVKQSGGHIWAYSEPGDGTTFKILLPRVPGPPVPLPARDHRPAISGRGRTVLVVEDDPHLRRIITHGLSASGFNVIEAANGPEAIDLAASHTGQIDLLLTDLVMPRMNGRQLAEEFRRLRPGAVPLYMSGYTDNLIVHQGVLDAGTAFIQKPFSAQKLVEKIAGLLDERDRQDATAGGNVE